MRVKLLLFTLAFCVILFILYESYRQSSYFLYWNGSGEGGGIMEKYQSGGGYGEEENIGCGSGGGGINNGTHVLLAPNIPTDSKTSYKIGGKYCKKNLEGCGEKEPAIGKYVFPIYKFLYDGIWESNDKIDEDVGMDGGENTNFYEVETKKWSIIGKGGDKGGKDGEYAGDEYIVLPKLWRDVQFDGAETDDTVFYNDLSGLLITGRNDYSKGYIENGKNYEGGIAYWKK